MMTVAQKMLMAKKHASGGGDPYWDNVTLLLHGDGTDGSTAFTDSSESATTITSLGSTKISTASSKFGGSSILFGTGLLVGSSLDCGTGDFTIECFVYPTVQSGGLTIYFSENSMYAASQLSVRLDNGYFGIMELAGYNNVVSNILGGTLVPMGQWSHIAAQRRNGNLEVYVDGALDATPVASTLNMTSDTGESYLGIRYKNRLSIEYGDFRGYIDEFRITSGIARFPGNFTPPTAPFPNG